MTPVIDESKLFLMSCHHPLIQGEPGLMGEVGPAGLPGLQVSLLPGIIDAALSGL